LFQTFLSNKIFVSKNLGFGSSSRIEPGCWFWNILVPELDGVLNSVSVPEIRPGSNLVFNPNWNPNQQF
jgi:hypothetical protein